MSPTLICRLTYAHPQAGLSIEAEKRKNQKTQKITAAAISRIKFTLENPMKQSQP
jgi:hypothetical protein